MIRLLQFLTLLTILRIGCSLGVTECRSLAYVCQQDPECLDDRGQIDSENRALLHHQIQSAKFIWQQPLTTNDQFQQFLSSNERLKSTINSYFDSSSQRQFAQIKQSPPQEYLQDIYNIYKQQQSTQDSVHVLQDHRNEYSLPKTINEPENSFLSLNDPEITKKKRNLLKTTFELVKTLLDKRKEYEDVHIISDAADTSSSTLKQTKKGAVIDEVIHPSTSLVDSGEDSSFAPSDITERNQETSSTDLSHKLGDREEIAVPVLSERSEIEVQEVKRNQEILLVKTLNSISTADAGKFGEELQYILWGINSSDHQIFHLLSVNNNTIYYRMVTDPKWFESADDIKAVSDKLQNNLKLREQIRKSTGITVIGADTAETPTQLKAVPLESIKESKDWDKLTVFTAVISACILVLVIVAFFICYIKRRNKDSSPVAFKKQEAVQDYQELCRTQMSVKNSRPEEDEPDTDKEGAMKGVWGDDSFPHNMDITTGHVILAYMEDHLQNENRLNKEWQALCDYKADENDSSVGADPKNNSKNRFQDVLPYNRTRVKLRETSNAFHSDYINANFITDADPRNPTYIATQGPLDNTIADFWQMVWENGIVVIVNLTKLSDMGLPQCHRYWPEDGSEIYHVYDVHLISEHIWCDDYLVRSLYLKNLQTAETRTITQFHYLSWPDLSTPDSPKSLLEFRRKVNKCYRGHACPIIVHCNNGIGRTGTYILLDMVLNKMVKGTKEIDIAATLEHLRDQRADMVKTKGQFEFALTALAEEVTAILSAVPR